MVSTPQFSLPLVMPAQAQKHVTVNEALAKIDAFVQMRIVSFSRSLPPSEPAPGESYFVASEMGGPWSGQVGMIATYINGGWIYTRPRVGWRAWDEEGGTCRVFDGASWIAGAMTVTSSGSAVSVRTDEFDHFVRPGATNLTDYVLPKNASVLGITGRVRAAVQGSGLASWRLGVEASDARYGTGLGTALNSYVHGLSASPLTYFEETRLLLSGEGGEFDSGLVTLSVHYVSLSIPREV